MTKSECNLKKGTFFFVTQEESKLLSLNNHDEMTKCKDTTVTESSVTAWVGELNYVGYQIY